MNLFEQKIWIWNRAFSKTSYNDTLDFYARTTCSDDIESLKRFFAIDMDFKYSRSRDTKSINLAYKHKSFYFYFFSNNLRHVTCIIEWICQCHRERMLARIACSVVSQHARQQSPELIAI